jgi:predicted lipoprotein with Yx(FWY)xxD motif
MGVRLRWVLPIAVLLAVAGVGAALAATMSKTSGGTVKAAQNAAYGSLLVTSAGMTLYHYTPDRNGAVKCAVGCVQFWPPLVVKAGVKPTAGAGIVKSKLSTVKRPDGRTQVTYAGFPLYRYSGDKKPGEVKGQGFEKIWFAVTAKGTLAKAGTSSGGSTPPPTKTMTDPYGGGGGYGGGG